MALCLLAPARSSAASHVPFDFIGIAADSTSIDPFRYSSQLDSMVRQGVGSVRFPVYWAFAQWNRNWSHVRKRDRSQYTDVGGVPTYWGTTDRLIGAMAERHLNPLPTVLNAPPWDAAEPAYPSESFAAVPKKVGPYARFLVALVRRYGQRGSFWKQHPELEPRPLGQIQVWNEPNIRAFWNTKPWDRKYVSLLRASHRAIKHVDPHVKVVFAGLSRDAWDDLDTLYRAGAHGAFDVMAVHPFTRHVSGLVPILKRVRGVMHQYGDGKKKLAVTEMSWPSARGKTDVGQDISVTPKQQAKNLTNAFKLLASKRKALRLSQVYWFTWLTFDKARHNHFDYAGVVTLKKHGRIKRKRAFYALGHVALGLEGCAAKADVADTCAP